MNRANNRKRDEPRLIHITQDYTNHAEGSVLIETGGTKVICTASIENSVPSHIKGKGTGWISAEYSMLPRSTHTRTRRERNRISGRTQEIQRLIGRTLRTITDLTAIGERTIWIDCDVIQADGGTRTSSITGGFVALVLAIRKLQLMDKSILTNPIKSQLAAISLGIVKKELLLDLDYNEDSHADVDMNIVMNGQFEILEIQGTAEKQPFSADLFFKMINLAKVGIQRQFDVQNSILENKI